MWSNYTSYDFERFFFKTCDIIIIMSKNNFRNFYDLFEIFDFSNSNFSPTFAQIIIDSRNIVWFFFSKNVFIFVQTIQLNFRRKIEIVIDIFENEKNVVKYYAWCRIMYDKFNHKIQNKTNKKMFTKFQFYFEIILIQIKFKNNNHILC